MQFFVSFGQVHIHSVNGKTLDKDCIAVIEAADHAAAHDKAFEMFDKKFCFVYDEVPDMEFFPRGLIYL